MDKPSINPPLLFWHKVETTMRYGRSNMLYQAAGLAIGISVALVAGGYGVTDMLPGAASISDKSCHIKGNISPNTGEKIYHAPGQEHYSETRIRTESGERWFCSEAEARAAGWRKERA